MVDIQCPSEEIRRGNKKEERMKKKPQDEMNIRYTSIALHFASWSLVSQTNLEASKTDRGGASE